MWWPIGIGIMFIFLSWPYRLRLTIKSDGFGKNWLLEIKYPLAKIHFTYKDGEIRGERRLFRRRQGFFMPGEKLLDKINTRVKSHSLIPELNLWQKSFLASFHIQKLQLKMGLKGALSGESAFIFGIILAFLYPFFGHLYYKRPDFRPKLSFDKESSGFSLSCIITFCLGQLIIEAWKRYWAWGKEKIRCKINILWKV